MPPVRYFKTDIGLVQPFAIKEYNAAGTLVAVDLSGKTVTIIFEDYDGNNATISGSDINITDASNGEGTFTLTSAVTADEKEWTTVQAKLVEGATYIEHSDPIIVVIGGIGE